MFTRPVHIKETSEIFTNKVLVKRRSQMVMFLLDNIKMVNQMERGNMNGKMGHIMTEISLKD